MTAPRISRAISAPQLEEIARALRESKAQLSPMRVEAIDYALGKAAPDDVIFITGSLYLVGQLGATGSSERRSPRDRKP